MDRWDVCPLISVNGVLFGTERAEVRKIFENHFNEFKRNEFSQNMVDDYGSFYVYYDKEDKLEAVEINGNIVLTLNGVQIFPGDRDLLCKISNNMEECYGTLIDKELSCGVTLNDNKIESILFGRKGYYCV